MARFEKPKKNGNKSSPPEGIKPKTGEKIIEPRCKVCQDKRRDEIDYYLAMKTPPMEMQRIFSIPYRSFEAHAKNHLQYENESIKQIIEYEAGIANENLDKGLRGAFLRRVTLDTSIKKVFDGILSGDVEIEAKDVIKMIELREKLDANTSAAQIEQYEIQFNAFKQAVEEICAPDMLQDIFTRIKELLLVGDRPAIQAPD